MLNQLLQNRFTPEIFDAAPVMMSVYDKKLNIIWANSAFLNQVGMTRDEISGQKCYSVMGMKEICRKCPVVNAMNSDTEQRGSIDIAEQGCCLNSASSWQVEASPLKDRTGKIYGSIQTITEISGQLSLLQRYENSNYALIRLLKLSTHYSSKKLLQKFLDEAETLTGSKIGFYHFVKADQVTLSLQTWSTNTLKTCSAPGAGTHYPVEQAGVWVDCIRARKPVIHNNYNSLKHKKGLPEGHVILRRELVVPVIRDDKIHAILGVGNKEEAYDEHDIIILSQIADLAWESIVRKRTEEENEKLQKQFVQAQKMDSIGKLAGGVAHDYNNMLSLITGYTEMSLDEVEPDSPIYGYLKEIMSAALRSKEITRQLLAFARRQTISPEIIDLNSSVEGMLKMLQRLIGEDIDLSWHPRTDIWPVKMDPIQVDQLLANLCINARDAISDVGKITIETGNITFDEKYCEDHPGFFPGEYARLVVSDNGCGMDRVTSCQIFEPFFTTKAPGEGTGLGLAMVYGIVKQNGGFINVYSEPGEGTSFHIYLARTKGGVFETKPEVEQFESKGQGETILIVEDEPSILNLLCKMLKGLSYNILAAESPDAALKIADVQGDSIDLLLTDVVMPEMNGRDLASVLQNRFPKIRTIYMSGYTANVIAHHGVLEKGVNFIQKPPARDELALKIKDVLNS